MILRHRPRKAQRSSASIAPCSQMCGQCEKCNRTRQWLNSGSRFQVIAQNVARR